MLNNVKNLVFSGALVRIMRTFDIFWYFIPSASREASWKSPSIRGAQGESFLGRKWLIGKKIKKELDKPEGISHAKMV